MFSLFVCLFVSLVVLKYIFMFYLCISADFVIDHGVVDSASK